MILLRAPRGREDLEGTAVMSKKEPEDKSMTKAEQHDDPKRRRKGAPRRLHTSPYLLKPLRSLEEATRETADKDDEGES